MADKSLISVADYKYDDPLSYESSKSSEFFSDDPNEEPETRSTPKPTHVKVNGARNDHKPGYMSDSINSDDQFLECESDGEVSSGYGNPFVDYTRYVDIYKQTRSLDKKRAAYRAKRSALGEQDDAAQEGMDLPSQGENGFGGNYDNLFTSARYNKHSGHASEHGARGGFGAFGNRQGEFVDPELVVGPSNDPPRVGPGQVYERPNDMDRASSFSDHMYDVNISDIGSDVNSEVETRIIDFHEAKRSVSEPYDESKLQSMQTPTNYVFEPEDEIDELFDRVINGEYDPEFTFMPEALDPYVKMSKELINRKTKAVPVGRSQKVNKSGTMRSSSSESVADLAKENEGSAEQEAAETSAESGPTKHKERYSDASTPAVNGPSPGFAKPGGLKAPGEPNLLLDHENDAASKALNGDKQFEYRNVTQFVENPNRNPVMLSDKYNGELRDIDISKSDSDVEKEKERVRRLFEATKNLESFDRTQEEETTKGIKVLKLKEDKKSKKSKHHKSDSDSDDEKHPKSEKKDKKSDEKAIKPGSSKSEKADEKPEKADKSTKEKKAEKKKLAWKSTDYDVIFSSLGECFSSGLIELDSKPIILARRGFYTIFFRNSKYPYDSSIDFYLFRIGFEYMLVNESRNQNFNIDDVVDYGNFRLKLSGAINLSPNVTKMALIYSNSDRQTLEFALTPSAFDSKPKIVYKLFYSGPMLSLPLPLKFRRRLRVLSLDNSENLGTSVIGALYLLEKKLSELKKKKVNLADYFDYICGTGAGALIALCLLKGYSMKDLRTQWNLIVSSLFKWVYSLPSGIIFDYYYIEEFKKNFINILGTDFLCSKTSPLCMVTCTNVRSNPYELFLFRNYGNSKFGSLDGTSYAPLWLVGWAACALPTYVRGPSNSHLNNIGYNMIDKTHLVDGCLVSSSPSLISLQELTTIYNINLRSLVKDNMDLFLSIGTSKSETDSSSLNSSTWQILMNCKNLMYNTQLQHLHVKNLFDEYENKYHRIQLPIYPGCKHGKTSKEDVDAVLTSTIQYISRHDNQRIEQIVNILNQ